MNAIAPDLRKSFAASQRARAALTVFDLRQMRAAETKGVAHRMIVEARDAGRRFDFEAFEAEARRIELHYEAEEAKLLPPIKTTDRKQGTPPKPELRLWGRV